MPFHLRPSHLFLLFGQLKFLSVVFALPLSLAVGNLFSGFPDVVVTPAIFHFAILASDTVDENDCCIKDLFASIELNIRTIEAAAARYVRSKRSPPGFFEIWKMFAQIDQRPADIVAATIIKNA